MPFTIRPLTEQDYEATVTLQALAYPSSNTYTPEERERMLTRIREGAEHPIATDYGCFQDEQLAGKYRGYDFTLTFRGVQIPAAGLGGVAVGMPYKKERAAKEMVQHFHARSRAEGQSLALLYPFRPDFYKQMGYGFAAKMYQYRLRTQAIPRGPSKENVRSLIEADHPAIQACYQHYADQTHGMIQRTAFDWNRIFGAHKFIHTGCFLGGELQGYLHYTFEPTPGGNWLQNDIFVIEFIYHTPTALRQLLTFLHTQFDQAPHVLINTQDENFHHLFADPRNNSNHIYMLHQETNVAGTGMMIRVVDVPGLFDALAESNFNGQTCVLRLNLTDDFIPESNGATTLRFQQGRVKIAPNAAPDIEIDLAIPEFSALIAGSLPFRALLDYGLAQISDPAWAATVNELFRVEQKPTCMTRF